MTQLAVIRKLTEEQYFIDSRRVIIWGWSYGGFAAAMALAIDSERLFRGAVSVAPVTDWNLYGTSRRSVTDWSCMARLQWRDVMRTTASRRIRFRNPLREGMLC